MGSGLKALVAVTCVVVAAVGYWFWKEYETGQQASRVAEYRAARDSCLDIVHRYVARYSAEYSDDLMHLIEGCVQRGLVNREDIDRIMRP